MKVFWLYFWIATVTGVVGMSIMAAREGQFELPFLFAAIAFAVAAVIEGSNNVTG